MGLVLLGIADHTAQRKVCLSKFKENGEYGLCYETEITDDVLGQG